MIIYIENWVMPNPLEVMALPSLLAFKGVWVFNLITSLFLIYIAGNVMERNKRGDWEALFVRPASNLSWVAGRAIAVLVVIGVVEVLALLVLGVLFVNDVVLCFDIYLFYLLTWSFPMNVFWIGGIALLSRWTVAREVRTILLLIIWGVLFFAHLHGGMVGDFMVGKFQSFSDAVDMRNRFLSFTPLLFFVGCLFCWPWVSAFDNDRRMSLFYVSLNCIVLGSWRCVDLCK
ncbi:MAG: hypothetical protein ACLU4N_28130 [Butyricimonas faecihominis]